jgi:hypothetical protein
VPDCRSPESSSHRGNGIYEFDRGTLQICLIAGTVGTLFFGFLAIMVGRQEGFSRASSIVGWLFSAACVALSVYLARLFGRTLQISDDGVSVRNKSAEAIGDLRWDELGHVSERRTMGQLALWDKLGRRRVLIDQQFENFGTIRSRVLAEYAKVFILKPFPIEFRNPNLLAFNSVILAVCAAFFAGISWMAFAQGQKGPGMILLGFLILTLLSILNLYPQLGGPSVLFVDRIVVRSLFRTSELYKANVASVEIEDVANSRSGTKFSLVVLRDVNGKRLKLTSRYGSVPEMYLTLQAWLALGSGKPQHRP